jgi:single-strand DNA-binding protein
MTNRNNMLEMTGKPHKFFEAMLYPNDPEVLKFESGKTLARFTLATNEPIKVNGVWQEQTQWHSITAWGKTAEIIQRILNKGQEIMLEGRLVQQNYESKTGEKRFGTTVELKEFLLLNTTVKKQETSTNKK